MDGIKNEGLEMDFKNLISCIECHSDSRNVSIILETLQTIIKICENQDGGKDIFREVGGIDFLVEFLTATENSFILDRSLETVAFVIDGNVHNQILLTKKEIFEVLSAIFNNPNFQSSILLNAILLLSAILYQNKAAQALFSDTSCMQDLIRIYSENTPGVITESTAVSKNEEPPNEIWLRTNSALCFSVNNPQNEKNQVICSDLFPQLLKLLESNSNSKTIVAVTSFLSLSIANNIKNQDFFAECDGFLILKRCLQKIFDLILSDMKICDNLIRNSYLQSINGIIGVISAGVLENEKNAVIFGKLGALNLLAKLLSLEVIGTQLKTRIILALGNCIDAYSENKSYLLEVENFDKLLKKNLLISDEELKCASNYLLQMCIKSEDAPGFVHM